MKNNSEFDNFNSAMQTILRADPKAVKQAMEKEHQAQAATRKAKGEKKRGRKPTRKSVNASGWRAVDRALEVAGELSQSFPPLSVSPVPAVAQIGLLSRDEENR